MFLDPMWFLFAAPGFLLALWAQWRVKSNFKKYSEVGTRRGMTGAQAAAALMRHGGVEGVTVEPTGGMLTDHYDPTSRTLRLSQQNYHGNSVAAVGIAAHEAGHALQHARNYVPMYLRSAIVPVANFGSTAGIWLFFIGAIATWQPLMIAGIIGFAAAVVFQLVTLPVEFDATSRAKRLVVEAGIVGEDERHGMDKVLNAAAWTYIAAALSAIGTLLYLVLRSGLLGGRR